MNEAIGKFEAEFSSDRCLSYLRVVGHPLVDSLRVVIVRDK